MLCCLLSSFPVITRAEHFCHQSKPSGCSWAARVVDTGQQWACELRKRGFCGWGEGKCISSHFPGAGWCVCFQKLEKTAENLRERESCSLLHVFFCTSFPVQLLWQAMGLPSKKPSFSLFWQIYFTSQMSCMLYVLILVLFSGCAHLSFSKYTSPSLNIYLHAATAKHP